MQTETHIETDKRRALHNLLGEDNDNNHPVETDLQPVTCS